VWYSCHMWRLIRRIRVAVAALFLPGDRMPITRYELQSFRLEFDEWRAEVTSIYDKLNALHARQIKRDKNWLSQQDAPPPGASATPPDKRALKLELSRQVLAGGMRRPSGPPPPPDGDDEP